VPVPVRDSVVEEGEALLVTVSVALTVTAVCGLNVIVNGTLWPVGIVTGSDNPLTVNCALFVPAAVTVTLAPLALKLPDAVPLVPTTTLPRFKVVGVAVNCPAVALPVPDKGIVKVEALEEIVMLPLTVPGDCGVKVPLKVALCPAASVTGVLIPLTPKPAPLAPTRDMVTLEPPVLVTVSDSV